MFVNDISFLLFYFVKELMTAAMGLNTSLIEDQTKKQRPKVGTSKLVNADSIVESSPSFAVIQALVALLAKSSNCSFKKSNFLADNIKSKFY